MMTYDEEYILNQLDDSREQLLLALADLPDEALRQPGVHGDWSAADVLANLAAWEAELVTGLMQVKGGRRPGRLMAALADPAAYDRQVHEANQNRDLDRIFDDFQQVRVQLEEWLSEFSARELDNGRRYRWLQGKPLGALIVETTAGREQSYLESLRQFAREWTGPPNEIIPLTIVATENKHDGNEPDR